MAQKRDNALCLYFCLGKNCPLALVLMPDTLVPLCVPLVPFKLLPQCWSSEGISLGKSVCGFFMRNCLGLPKFLPPTQSSLVFATKSCGKLSSWHWNPGLGGLVCAWDSSLWRYPSRIFIHHMWAWDQPIPHKCFSYHSLDGCGFFNSIVVNFHSTRFHSFKLLFKLISDSSE